jgi:hypothetical protein
LSIFDNYLLTKNIYFVMKIKELSPAILSVLKNKRYDRIVEKHEGPESWDWQLPYDAERIEALKSMYKNSDIEDSVSDHADFIQIDNVDVLLPVGSDHHPNITILHHFFSENRQKIVLYIKDTTYDDGIWGAGFIAICDKYPYESFYVATLYHEWYIIDYDSLADKFKEL